MRRALFEAFPALADTLPVYTFAELPTPLKPLKHFAATGNYGDLWIKQDNLTGTPYGGNKIRKLEFLLGDALEQDYNDVITFGAAGSNHALATAIFAKQLGLIPHVVVSPQPDNPKIQKTLAYHQHLGTHLVTADGYREIMQTAEDVETEVAALGRKTYRIPFGGSSAVGAIGFVNAAFELKEQIANGDMPEPQHIYIACGTTGSATGLSLGLQLADLDCQVIAVQVTPAFLSGQEAHVRLFDETASLLHALCPDITVPADPLANITHTDSQFGEGYGEATTAGKAAVELLEKTEGIALETTYTGKALAALVADDRDDLLSGQTTLFWNTYNSHPYPELPQADVTTLPEALRQYVHN